MAAVENEPITSVDPETNLNNADTSDDQSESEADTPNLKEAFMNLNNQYLDVTAFLLDQNSLDESRPGSKQATVVEETFVEEKVSILGKII